MKKTFMILTGIMTIATAAHAEFVAVPRGGFVDESETIITVDQAKNMRDDSYVVVQGNIAKRTGSDKYLFQDETGTVTIEIDDDDWNGVTVTPTDTIKIHGKMDRGLTKTEIDVDYLELVQ